jgi:hypothetical protein
MIMNDWISVDIPPSLEKRIHEDIVLCATTSGTCVAWLSRNTLSFLEEPRGMALPFKVTHWMPLPAPPEELK